MPRINYTVEQLRDKAIDVRRDIVAMCGTGVWGGCGSSLAGADLMTTLFFYEINFDRTNLDWDERDVWHVSSQPLAAALYATMAEAGLFPLKDLLTGGEVDSHVAGFPSSRTPGIEVSGGVPGAGLSTAVGIALASRIDNIHRRVYCLMDDSEVQTGQFWEAALAAAHFELQNLVLVVDFDGRQRDGDIEDVLAVAPLTEKLRSFNWHTLEAEGNDVEAIVGAFDKSRSMKNAPVAILNVTTAGHGVSFMEDDDAWLTQFPNEEQVGAALAELGTSTDDWVKRLSA